MVVVWYSTLAASLAAPLTWLETISLTALKLLSPQEVQLKNYSVQCARRQTNCSSLSRKLRLKEKKSADLKLLQIVSGPVFLKR